MPVPPARRPSLPVTAGDHEERIRALERQRPATGGALPFMDVRCQFSAISADDTAYFFLEPNAPAEWFGYIDETVFLPPTGGSPGTLFSILVPGLYLFDLRTTVSGETAPVASVVASTEDYDFGGTVPKNLDNNSSIRITPDNVINPNFGDWFSPFTTHDEHLIALNSGSTGPFPDPMPIGVAIRGGTGGDLLGGQARLRIVQLNPADADLTNIYDGS